MVTYTIGSNASKYAPHQLLSNEQHGFVPNRSCESQLLTMIKNWSETLQDGFVDVIYLDLKKTLDTVPHKQLLLKLQAYGICGSIFNWIQSFLMEESKE